MDFIYDSEVFIDLYSILDVDIEAKSEEIKACYLKLVKVHHPDHGGNPEMFQQITKAYEILHNKDTRKEYDLYYLKKSMDEFKGDDFNRLKSDYTNFVNANTKPVSKEKLDEMYEDIFKDREQFKENKIDENELEKRINDIGFERENMSIENNSDMMLQILKEINSKSDTPITISEFFEYLKHKNLSSNTNKQIMIGEIGTLDTLPGYSSNFTSFVSDSEYFGSNMYSDIVNNGMEFQSEDNNDIDMEDFIRWKNTKRHDSKLSQDELKTYLERRRLEEDSIFNEVETNLQNKSKKREVEKFLKTKHLSENIEEYYDGLHNKDNINNTETQQTNSNENLKPKADEDVLDYMERIKSEERKPASNVRKREFK